MNKTNRTIQIIAVLIIIATLLLLAAGLTSQSNRQARVTPMPNPISGTVSTSGCLYELTRQESGLPATIYLDLSDGEPKTLTFGVHTKFNAECVAGKIRYWIAEINPMCVRGSITLSSDGTWGCTLDTNDPHIVAFEFELGGHWIWPQGQPDVEWIEPPLIPLLTPVPTPLPGLQI